MRKTWLDRLTERARVTVEAHQDELARILTVHDKDCCAYVETECLIATLGYTATSFMVAWAAGQIPRGACHAPTACSEC